MIKICMAMRPFSFRIRQRDRLPFETLEFVDEKDSHRTECTCDRFD